MAITAATTRSDFDAKFLPPEIAGPIFEEAARMSVVQRLAPQVPLGINGKAVPVVTGKISAGWVSEGGQKPASEGTVGLKTIEPKKLATIAVVSAEVVRSNPANYMSLIRSQVAEAFAVAFDAAALHGTSTPFTTYIDQTNKSVALGTTAQGDGGVHGDIVAGLKELVDDGKKLTGFALDDVVEPTLLAATDTNGRPIYIDTPLDETTAAARPGRLLGRPSYMGDGVAAGEIVGYGGNWSQAAWGVVGGISYAVSTEATVTINGALTSLFENNLVAVLAEAEYGWLVNDPDAFVQYTDSGQGSGS